MSSLGLCGLRRCITCFRKEVRAAWVALVVFMALGAVLVFAMRLDRVLDQYDSSEAFWLER